MFKITFLAAALAVLTPPVTASQLAGGTKSPPTAAELQELMNAGWPSFARRIHLQELLVELPSRLISTPQALCRRVLIETYECVSLVNYQTSNGSGANVLLRHHVTRDSQGKLLDAIAHTETAAPRR